MSVIILAQKLCTFHSISAVQPTWGFELHTKSRFKIHEVMPRFSNSSFKL